MMIDDTPVAVELSQDWENDKYVLTVSINLSLTTTIIL